MTTGTEVKKQASTLLTLAIEKIVSYRELELESLRQFHLEKDLETHQSITQNELSELRIKALTIVNTLGSVFNEVSSIHLPNGEELENYKSGFATGVTWKEKYRPGGPFMHSPPRCPGANPNYEKTYKQSVLNNKAYLKGFDDGILEKAAIEARLNKEYLNR